MGLCVPVVVSTLMTSSLSASDHSIYSLSLLSPPSDSSPALSLSSLGRQVTAMCPRRRAAALVVLERLHARVQPPRKAPELVRGSQLRRLQGA